MWDRMIRCASREAFQRELGLVRSKAHLPRERQSETWKPAGTNLAWFAAPHPEPGRVDNPEACVWQSAPLYSSSSSPWRLWESLGSVLLEEAQPSGGSEGRRSNKGLEARAPNLGHHKYRKTSYRVPLLGAKNAINSSCLETNNSRMWPLNKHLSGFLMTEVSVNSRCSATTKHCILSWKWRPCQLEKTGQPKQLLVSAQARLSELPAHLLAMTAILLNPSNADGCPVTVNCSASKRIWSTLLSAKSWELICWHWVTVDKVTFSWGSA